MSPNCITAEVQRYRAIFSSFVKPSTAKASYKLQRTVLLKIWTPHRVGANSANSASIRWNIFESNVLSQGLNCGLRIIAGSCMYTFFCGFFLNQSLLLRCSYAKYAKLREIRAKWKYIGPEDWNKIWVSKWYSYPRHRFSAKNKIQTRFRWELVFHTQYEANLKFSFDSKKLNFLSWTNFVLINFHIS